MQRRTHDSSKQRLVAVYTRLAVVYDLWTAMLERRSLEVALERADIRDGQSILEVAVGSGQVFREVLRRNPTGRNVGTDITRAMLRKTYRKAESTGVPFELEEGDARHLAFADATFDLVLSNNMLGLLPVADAERAVGEMARVLRRGGRLVLVQMVSPTRALPRRIYRLGAVRLGGWSELELEPILRANQCDVIEREVVTQLGFPSEILVGRRW